MSAVSQVRSLVGGRRRSQVLVLLARLFAVALLVTAAVGLFGSAAYQTPAGEVRYRLAPAWPGGGVVLPLGPAGEVRLQVHRAPLDVRAEFMLDPAGALPGVLEARELLDGLPEARADAEAAFDSFAWSRIPWLALLGVSAGLLVTPFARGRRLRRGIIGAFVGLAGLAVLVGGLVGTTLLTLDRSPAVTYRGLASNLPRAVTLLRTVLEENASGASTIRDYLQGLQSVASQFADMTAAPRANGVVRLLVVGDIHDNIVGMRIASTLATSSTVAVDGVVLVGDLTHRGTSLEANLFTRFFDPGETPVFVVGGNHEDAGAMERWRAAGYRVLDGDAADVGNLTLFGVTDPLANSPAASPDAELLESAAAVALERWQSQDEYPEILVVHDIRQARAVMEWTEEQQPLVVFYGHDHVAAVRQEGAITLVGSGTGGASGYESVGRDPNTAYTFQLVEFSQDPDPVVLSVTTLRYTGLDGRSTAEYIPLVP